MLHQLRGPGDWYPLPKWACLEFMTIQMLTSSQVARRLELSVERVRQLARAGVLPPDEFTELGRLWRLDTVERFAASRTRLGRFPEVGQ